MNVSKHILAMLCAAGAVCAVSAESAQKTAAAAPAEPVAIEEQEDDLPSLELSFDYCTRQTTYGLTDNPDPIYQIGGVIEWRGFSFEVGSIWDTSHWGKSPENGGYGDRKNKYQELTFGPGYSYQFSPDDFSWLPTTVELGGNYIYEYHPATPRRHYGRADTNPDTQFINVNAGLPDLWLEPALSVEFDIDNEMGAQYYLAEIGHTFLLLGKEDDPLLDFGLTAGLGFGNAKRNEYDADWHKCAFKDVSLTGTLTFYPCRYVSIAPYVVVSDQLGGPLRDAARESDGSDHKHAYLYGGVALTASF